LTTEYLLDTNVVSEPLKPDPDPRVLSQLKRHQDVLAISSTVWHELCFGALRLARGRKRRILVEYLEISVRTSMPIIPYDEMAASIHAEQRARLVATGRTPSFADGQIAATAIANDLTLVTSNTHHFKLFEGLVVQDWRAKKSTAQRAKTKRRRR
jgi:tRNA(fMet)-specific endonuclease VapC